MTMHRSILLPVAVASWLILAQAGAAPLQAQTIRLQAPGGLKQLPAGFFLDPKPLSYQPLQDDPHEFRPGAEWEVQGRLQALQQLQEMQKNARKLARDPDLVNKLRGFRPEQVEELRKRFQSADGLNASPQMQELLKKLAGGHTTKDLSQENLDALRDLADKPAQPVTPPTTEGPAPPTPDNSSPSPSPPDAPGPDNVGAPPAPQSDWDQFQEEAADWVRDNLRDAGGDLADAVDRWQGASESQALRDLFTGKSVEEGGLRYRLAEQAQGLSSHLPRLNLHVPQVNNALDPFRSLWTHVEPPRLGGFSASAPRGVSTALGDWAFAVLFGLVGVLLLVLIGRQVQMRRAGYEGDGGQALGPWPVAPQAVSTRQQLVRAFEYLALWSLGLEARSCHHLDVAEQLARRGGDSAHEQAAESLARLYEQARYAPDSEPLGPDELAAARRHLCFLAGVNLS
jgi:hypothetical protein